ncbi:MAG: hypothetical protein QM478_11590 [Flavobacteriaceae bacterium]
MKQLDIFCKSALTNLNKIQVNLIEFYYHIHNIIESEGRKHFACHIILTNEDKEKNLLMPLRCNYTSLENEVFKFISRKLEGDFFDLHSCTAEDIFHSTFIDSEFRISISEDVFNFYDLSEKINKEYLENLFKLEGVSYG